MLQMRPNVAGVTVERREQNRCDFDEAKFLDQLLTEANCGVAIEEALPQLIANLGQLHHSEILAASRIDPHATVGALSAGKLERLCRALARAHGGSSRLRRNSHVA